MDVLYSQSRHSNTLLYPLFIITLLSVALLTVPSVLAFRNQIKERESETGLYEDVDGTSEPNVVAAFSNWKPKAAVLAFSLLGACTSIPITVLTILDVKHGGSLESWLMAFSWCLIATQAIMLMAIQAPVQAHNLGYWTLFSSMVTLIATTVQTCGVFDRLARDDQPRLVLQCINILAALGVLFASVLIPRRPVVQFRGQPVMAQWTCSVLSRFTWTWVWPLIRLASNKGDLSEKDVPQPDHTIRAESVLSDWSRSESGRSLVWEILHFYKGRLALQWSVTLLRCVVGAAPYWAMLQLINKLEQRGGGGSPDRDMWGLVIMFGLLVLAEQWLDGWASFYSVTMVSQPLRVQLSALVYEKSLRRKNVKSAEKPRAKEPLAAGGVAGEVEGEALLSTMQDPGDDDDEQTMKSDQGRKDNASSPPGDEGSSVLKSRQATVNLVGVDSRRIADFASYQFLLVSSIGKFAVYSIFLIQLIGWVSFMAGIIAWALILPVNTYFSKQYIRLSEELMSVRDKKLAVVNEALLGIRQIKFAALEGQWEKRIMDMRDAELNKTWKIFLGDTALFSCWVISPIFLAAASLATYTVVNGQLSPSIAFTSLSMFKSLEVALGALPDLLATAFDTVVSIKRVDTYLKGPEMKKVLTDGTDITFENAAIAWPVDDDDDDDGGKDEDRFVLGGLNFTFPRGELSVISGKTGAGKSLVLSALIGEADVLGGKIYVPTAPSVLDRHDAKAHPGNWILPGCIAFVAQTPWLEGASLRENILFGLPMMEARYEEVLQACALERDLDVLADGDGTELGANGVNLSGGQKWRVTLARAVYSRAEVLILDDIFSAVDAHVGRQIFERCIGGRLCRGRTRILVTHHVDLVRPKTKFLVELGEGRVLHAADLDLELQGHGALVRSAVSSQQLAEELEHDDMAALDTQVNSETSSTVFDDVHDGSSTCQGMGMQHTTEAKKFVQEETRDKGRVKMRVYTSYMKCSGGWLFWIMCATLYIGFEATDLLRVGWVRIWTGSSSSSSSHGGAFGGGGGGDGGAFKAGLEGLGHAFSLMNHGLVANQPMLQKSLDYGNQPAMEAAAVLDGSRVHFYLWVYVGISLGMGIVGTCRFFWSFLMSIKASRVMFSSVLGTVLRTPLRWLDTVPVGRILNRLTSDFEIIDQRLTVDLAMLSSHVLTLVGVCVAAALVSPYMLPAIVVLLGIAALMGNKYLDGARPMRRLESTSKSPVFELFNSTLSGISTLRAFQKKDVYAGHMHRGMDRWSVVSVCMWTMTRWLSLRMALLGALFTTAVGAVVILSRHVDAALAGFTLSFALNLTANMIFAVRNISQLELDMNSAERAMEYSELETESRGGEAPPAAWPTSGRIEVEDLVVGYARDLPPVLRGVSFRVGDNERVGVIGRTGAGKSSLTLALFRFLEPTSGAVLIDGLDIAKMDLRSLRSRLAIIPQDPVLFSGTIRSNLDPFNERTDAELRAALARVHLANSPPESELDTTKPSSSSSSSNTNMFRDLSSPITESGENLSQGQRQLLCLARAIVSRPKIMVLDEATSAVDMATDALIQRSIREEFTGSTLLVIAHRLSTVADFDRILVLDEGTVAEYGTPAELWEREGGVFRDMCESSGERWQLEQLILGNRRIRTRTQTQTYE